VLCLAGNAVAQAVAQGEQTRVEIGAGLAGMLVENDESASVKVSTGLTGQVDVNMARRLAIELRSSWFPRDQSIRFQTQGGQTFHLAAGAKATFVEGHRVALYGLVLPGLVHFTESLVTLNRVGPTTHFALGLGGGVDVRATRRLAARLEWISDLYGYPGAEGPLSPPGSNGGQSQVSIAGGVTGTWQIRGGLTYRAGPWRAVESERRLTDRGAVGGQFTLTTFLDGNGVRLRHVPGGRAYASYRLAEYVYADGVVGANPGSGVVTKFQGGRMALGLAGVKIGLRRDRVGTFFKTRVGVIRHSWVLTAATTSPHSFNVGPSYVPALDLGAVVEIYVGRRFLIRLDAGDVVSLPRTVTFVRDGVPTPLDAPSTDSIELAVGAGWRF
jgi:hypothetical protein